MMAERTANTQTAVAVLSCLLLATTSVYAFVESPKFSQLRLLYPGYPEYGGQYSHDRLLRHVFFDQSSIGSAADAASSSSSSSKQTAVARGRTVHHSAAVRLSWTLNRFGGRHAIGSDPIRLSSVAFAGPSSTSAAVDSFAGSDGQQYIFRNEAFGPFLAARYGNPEVVRTTTTGSATVSNSDRKSMPWPMSVFVGRQGIVRVVSFRRRRENGHVALWDCDHFHQSRDWSTEEHVIAIEFWESPDSSCPEQIDVVNTIQSPPQASRLVAVDHLADRLVPRHNFQSPEYLLDSGDDHIRSASGNQRNADTAQASSNSRYEHASAIAKEDQLWLQ